MDFGDVNETCQTIHDFAQSAVSLFVIRSDLPVLRDKELHGLCQCFVPLDQPFDPFVYSHPVPSGYRGSGYFAVSARYAIAASTPPLLCGTPKSSRPISTPA